MAITASRPDVTTAATLIAQNTAGDPGEGDYRSARFVIKNVTSTASLFLGPSGVTSSTGVQWDPADGSLSFELEPGESLYAILASAQPTQTLHVLKGGR